jgi:hypothetical protein
LFVSVGDVLVVLPFPLLPLWVVVPVAFIAVTSVIEFGLIIISV